MTIATSNFLVPNGTLIVELIAFLIVLGVIAKWVLPILDSMMTERQEQIRSELAAADAAKADADAADAERRSVLDAARRQAREIVDQANRTADQVTTAAQTRAQAEYERIVQAADAEVAVARQAAVEQVTAQVGAIVVAAAERVVGREIRASDHQDLIDEAVAAVRAGAEAGEAAAGAPGAGR
ncbi:MAG: F0F1 ATP synthase subunit B [Actinomycetota bacterium]|jgi:F-type H+-transporting ATPase subunit b|nr:F0F1 ATP synthase subunit B [Actinomycetota bacterium]